MTMDATTFLDRVENTGMVQHEIAEKLCMTGVVGRASGIPYDVRLAYPYEIYKEIKTGINIQSIGGVFERFLIKVAEINDAFSFIEKALIIIHSDIKATRTQIALQEGLEGVAIVETVKGELLVFGRVGTDNRFSRISFKTPSTTNWDGLTYAVLGEIVPDFPLCNKSFNCSYSENDR
jgi:formate hydrogenlyase subunit 5